MNKKALMEVMLDANTPMTRKIRAAALRIRREKTVKSFTPDKEVWHGKTKKWLDHKDPKLTESSGGYDYSSTQINLPVSLATQVMTYGRMIKDSDLASDGREKNPHITIKYGLRTNNVDKVRKVLRGWRGPIRYKLGKISKFECKDYDVIKIEVVSPDLHKMNALIKNSLPCKDTHPTYNPHATIAYVKKDHQLKDPGDHFEGMTGSARTVVFSTTDDKEHVIELGG